MPLQKPDGTKLELRRTDPDTMCHHTILAVLQFTVVSERARDAGETLRLSEIYDLYSPAVYGALLATMGCEQCASAVLVRTFSAVRISEQESPKLYRLLQDAFTCSCAATPEADREELRERIRNWFMKGQAVMMVAIRISRAGYRLTSQYVP